MDILQRGRGRVETLVTLVSQLSEQSPLLLRLEDLHWAEPALLDYLTGLVMAAAEHPILLLLTSRLQGDPVDRDWRDGIGAASFLAMDLEPLNANEAQSLVLEIEGIDADWSSACIERSGGNPSFLEQLLRSQEAVKVKPCPGPRRCLDRLHRKRQSALGAIFCGPGPCLGRCYRWPRRWSGAVVGARAGPPAVPEHRPASHRGGASAINLSLSTSRTGTVKR